MTVALVYDPAMTAYDLGPWHPLKPERFALAVDRMHEARLLDAAPVLSPSPASEEDVLRVHSSAYIEAVKEASEDPRGFRPRMGLGTGDNPVFGRMHEASLLICGGTILALGAVLEGRFTRTFNPAGGLHHAHREQAAGFCVYNDPAVAIAAARAADPSLRIAYVDIDAHHGDGVQEAFYDTPDVLTVSVHEAGTHLFPGTGFTDELGEGPGLGYSLNLPLPPGAVDECYALAFERVIGPALRAFAPDAIVLQCGADAHHGDPLTTLGMTLDGHRSLVRSVLDTAGEVCSGRVAACGGGGYQTADVVPLAWARVFAELLGERSALPAEDRHEVRAERRNALVAATERTVAELEARTPLLAR